MKLVIADYMILRGLDLLEARVRPPGNPGKRIGTKLRGKGKKKKAVDEYVAAPAPCITQQAPARAGGLEFSMRQHISAH